MEEDNNFKYRAGDIIALINTNPYMILEHVTDVARDPFTKTTYNVEMYKLLRLNTGEFLIVPKGIIEKKYVPQEELTEENPTVPL